MRIIGIDPGTAITGFSIIERGKGRWNLLEYGCIRTHAGTDAGERLHQIALDLETLITTWKPDHACIEKIFFNTNVKTAVSVMQARGVILQKLAEHGVERSEFTPLEIKLAVCGYGKADKKMVQRMIQMVFNLESAPTPDDAADAIAAALCAAHSIHTIKIAV